MFIVVCVFRIPFVTWTVNWTISFLSSSITQCFVFVLYSFCIRFAPFSFFSQTSTLWKRFLSQSFCCFYYCLCSYYPIRIHMLMAGLPTPITKCSVWLSSYHQNLCNQLLSLHFSIELHFLFYIHDSSTYKTDHLRSHCSSSPLSLSHTSIFLSQNLAATTALRKHFLSVPSTGGGPLENALREFMDNMWSSKSGSFNPSMLHSTIQSK